MGCGGPGSRAPRGTAARYAPLSWKNGLMSLQQVSKIIGAIKQFTAQHLQQRMWLQVLCIFRLSEYHDMLDYHRKVIFIADEFVSFLPTKMSPPSFNSVWWVFLLKLDIKSCFTLILKSTNKDV